MGSKTHCLAVKESKRSKGKNGKAKHTGGKPVKICKIKRQKRIKLTQDKPKNAEKNE